MKLIFGVLLLIALCSVTLSKRIPGQNSDPGVGLLRKRFTKGFLPESRMAGGSKAAEGAYPYQVSLQTVYDEHFCAGAIIDEYWVVTAAHCVTGWNPDYIRVVTGTNQISSPGQTYGVDLVKIHCNYDRPLYHNDIALLKMKTKIVFNEKTQKIDYDFKPLKEGEEVVLTGWGSDRLYGKNFEDLQFLKLNFVPHNKCLEMHKNDKGVDIGHICTLGEKGVGQGTCHGDSGGPLVRDGKLVGIVNWGEPCAKGVPDMHASISFYHDFIRTNLKGCNEELKQ